MLITMVIAITVPAMVPGENVESSLVGTVDVIIMESNESKYIFRTVVLKTLSWSCWKLISKVINFEQLAHVTSTIAIS